MADPTCIEPDCTRPIRCRGLCNSHYSRHRRNGTAPPPLSRLDRFMAHVVIDPSGCHIWTGARDPRGYGRLGTGSRRTGFAHRWALERALGRPLAPGMFCLHRCDTPACVNPDHLYEGPHAQNMNDMTSRLRQPWGERNGNHKLTEQEVRAIRRRAAAGESQSSIARDYPVAQSTISRVVSGVRWAVLV